MIKDKGQFYLYRWIRKDTNQVFYVGVGTKHSDRFNTEYKRAYHLSGRNVYFISIYNSCDCFVEILLESYSREFILQKEIEFIKLYKRKCDAGTLCNFSLGGESGILGIKKSSKERSKISKRMQGNSRGKTVKVINTITKEVFNSVSKAAKSVSICSSGLSSKLKGVKRNNTSFVLLSEYKGETYTPIKSLVYVKVIDLDTRKIFDTSIKCAKYFNKHPSYINGILKGRVRPKKNPINIKYYVE